MVVNKTKAYPIFLLDQRNVGVELKVERSSVDTVKERLAMLKRKRDEPKKEDYGKKNIWHVEL